MWCPQCNHIESDVYDSRPTKLEVRRRRKCRKCKYTWGTVEVSVSKEVKKDRRLTPQATTQLKNAAKTLLRVVDALGTNEAPKEKKPSEQNAGPVGTDGQNKERLNGDSSE